MNVPHLHKHIEPGELPAALPGTLNHMSKRQENNIPGNSYREKQRYCSMQLTTEGRTQKAGKGTTFSLYSTCLMKVSRPR